MGDELIFDEKKYISASRASELYGYSSDYIGQLCRKNILDFRRVGRAWYVNENSLISHKATASAAQRGRIPGLKDGEPVFDGKKYISTSRAAKTAGYSADYISQLCRKGVLESRKVGKSWFVSEESLQAHREAASSTPRGRIPMYEKDFVPQTTGSSVGVAVMPNPLGVGLSPEMSYKSFHQTAISFLDRKEESRQTSDFAHKVVLGALVVVALMVFIVPNVIGGDVVSRFVSEFGVNATAQATKTGFFESIKNFLAVEGEKITRSIAGDTNTQIDGNVGGAQGIVVVPSARSAEENDQVKKYIQDNFSDEVKVTPDAAGDSGVIKPVFKNKNNQEYTYVMVPVKDTSP